MEVVAITLGPLYRAHGLVFWKTILRRQFAHFAPFVQVEGPTKQTIDCHNARSRSKPAGAIDRSYVFLYAPNPAANHETYALVNDHSASRCQGRTLCCNCIA